jgi:hypothetical protein
LCRCCGSQDRFDNRDSFLHPSRPTLTPSRLSVST